MKKFFALAFCAAAFTGCDFAGGSADGPALAVSQIAITQMPFDTEADGPDLTLQIVNAAGRTFWLSETIENVTTTPPVFEVNAEIVNAERDYFLVLMDREGDGYRAIATTNAFSGTSLQAAGGTLELSSIRGSAISATITGSVVE